MFVANDGMEQFLFRNKGDGTFRECALDAGPSAHEMLGVALLSQGYAAESIPHFEKAGTDALLGVALLEAGRARDAVDKLEAALQKQPGKPDLLYYLGQAHSRLSKQRLMFFRQRVPLRRARGSCSGKRP